MSSTITNATQIGQNNFTTADCTLDICPIDDSFFDYRPSLAANSALCALFAISLLLNSAQGVAWKTWSFMAVMILGNICEVLGYAARILAYDDPFNVNWFLMQICCLTLAPAFFAAGIYLSLSRIIIIYSADISRLRPKWYTRIFVTCDVISLILQGAGGGIASVRAQNDKDPKVGNNIMLAGLSFQVFTLSLFMILCAEYAWRVKRTHRMLSPEYETLRSSKRFKAFIGALTLSTICIQIRCIYRVIELSQGWDGHLISVEKYFIVLEGVMVIIAVLALNIVHPGLGFRNWSNGKA